MASIQWKKGMLVRQDSDARLDYALILTDWLGLNPDTPQDKPDFIISHVITSDAEFAPATVVFSTYGDDKDLVYFWLSDLTVSQTITIQVTTNNGRTDDFSIYFETTEK